MPFREACGCGVTGTGSSRPTRGRERHAQNSGWEQKSSREEGLEPAADHYVLHPESLPFSPLKGSKAGLRPSEPSFELSPQAARPSNRRGFVRVTRTKSGRSQRHRTRPCDCPVLSGEGPQHHVVRISAPPWSACPGAMPVGPRPLSGPLGRDPVTLSLAQLTLRQALFIGFSWLP